MSGDNSARIVRADRRVCITRPAVVHALLVLLLLTSAPACNGQGYRRSAFFLGGNRVEMAKLRALYSASRSFRVAYRASPSSACAKGSPGRRSASLCAPSAQDAQAAEQAMQLMIATSPIVFSSTNASDTGGVLVVSPPGNQAPCETCIAFAVGAAAEAAVASVLRVSVLLVNISVQSLYYCAESGPTLQCRSGWTLPEALNQLMQRGHKLPTVDCLPYLPVSDIYAYRSKQAVCTGTCTNVNAYSPMGRFDYLPIRDIWEAQRHIRHYGGVVSSFYVYDDLEPFFSNSANREKVYRPGPNAQSMFGHAVLLVGYVNTEDGGYWVVKNSYGNKWGDNGFFRVAFGVCSILTSDGEAFGVVWVPSSLSKLPPLEVYKSSSNNCYWYLAKSGDYVSRIAWLADIPLWQLLLDNTKAVVDLDKPLTGTTLLLCNPAQGRYKVLSGSAPPFTVQPTWTGPKSSPPPPPSPSPPPGGAKEQFCSWSEVDGTCIADLSIAQRSLKSQPATVWQKINLFRYDRQNHCAALKTEAACTASSAKYRCYWDGSNLDSEPQDRNFCYSNDFLLGSKYRDTIGELPAPEFLACAGSKAREFMRCNSIRAKLLCPKIPGCGRRGPVGRRGACYPKWYLELPAAEADKFDTDLAAFKPEVWGTCEGACVMKQGKVCNTTGTTKAGCMKHPFCYWYTTKECQFSLWEGEDAFTKAVNKIEDDCNAQKTKAKCEALVADQQPHQGKWLDWQGPSDSNFKCSIS